MFVVIRIDAKTKVMKQVMCSFSSKEDAENHAVKLSANQKDERFIVRFIQHYH